MELIYMEKTDFHRCARRMFEILAENMNAIAPTGNRFEEDFCIWFAAMEEMIQADTRRILLIREDGEIVGYFQYNVENDLFKMEEFEIAPLYQGTKGIFRAVYAKLMTELAPAPAQVEAYANKKNAKSCGILSHLGLKIVGENRSGRSWHFRGTYADLVKWYQK